MNPMTVTRFLAPEPPPPAGTDDPALTDPVRSAVRTLWRVVENWALTAPNLERRHLLDVARRAERLRTISRSTDGFRVHRLAYELLTFEANLPADAPAVSLVRDAIASVKKELTQISREVPSTQAPTLSRTVPPPTIKTSLRRHGVEIHLGSASPPAVGLHAARVSLGRPSTLSRPATAPEVRATRKEPSRAVRAVSAAVALAMVVLLAGAVAVDRFNRDVNPPAAVAVAPGETQSEPAAMAPLTPHPIPGALLPGARR